MDIPVSTHPLHVTATEFGFCSLRCQADRVFQDAEEFPGPQGIEWQ